MSLIPNTYDGLVSAVVALAEDQSQEFSNYIPTAIYLGEERLIRELDTQGVKTVTSAVVSAGNPFVTKPTGYRLGFDVSYRTSTGEIKQLSKKTDSFIRDYWPIPVSTGHPKYYADIDNTTFLVGPTPASAFNFTFLHTKQVDHVSVLNQANYFTLFCVDALFYATMSNMAEFMKDYSIQQVWEAKYANAVAGLNNEGRRSRRDDDTVPSNPKVATNTLKGDN